MSSLGEYELELASSKAKIQRLERERLNLIHIKDVMSDNFFKLSLISKQEIRKNVVYLTKLCEKYHERKPSFIDNMNKCHSSQLDAINVLEIQASKIDSKSIISYLYSDLRLRNVSDDFPSFTNIKQLSSSSSSSSLSEDDSTSSSSSGKSQIPYIKTKELGKTDNQSDEQAREMVKFTIAEKQSSKDRITKEKNVYDDRKNKDDPSMKYTGISHIPQSKTKDMHEDSHNLTDHLLKNVQASVRSSRNSRSARDKHTGYSGRNIASRSLKSSQDKHSLDDNRKRRNEAETRSNLRFKRSRGNDSEDDFKRSDTLFSKRSKAVSRRPAQESRSCRASQYQSRSSGALGSDRRNSKRPRSPINEEQISHDMHASNNKTGHTPTTTGSLVGDVLQVLANTNVQDEVHSHDSVYDDYEEEPNDDRDQLTANLLATDNNSMSPHHENKDELENMEKLKATCDSVTKEAVKERVSPSLSPLSPNKIIVSATCAHGTFVDCSQSQSFEEANEDDEELEVNPLDGISFGYSPPNNASPNGPTNIVSDAYNDHSSQNFHHSNAHVDCIELEEGEALTEEDELRSRAISRRKHSPKQHSHHSLRRRSRSPSSPQCQRSVSVRHGSYPLRLRRNSRHDDFRPPLNGQRLPYRLQKRLDNPGVPEKFYGRRMPRR